MAAPIKHKIPKIRANLEKFIFWEILIKKCKLKIPTEKLKNKDRQLSQIKIGFSKNK